MTRYIPMRTPGGLVWTEVEEHPTAQIVLTGLQDEALKSFQDTIVALKKNAQVVLEQLVALSPDEVEISFGIKAGVEGGTPFFGLAKASGEASYSVALKWNAKEAKPEDVSQSDSAL